MRLKKLVIHGFKSFADRVEVTFENGITGVVGPNGCGKSNIADAVRWVLGEQSAKTLRGSKMEDVIFNGTEKRRRLAFCEVTLTFDNEDKALPVDFTEVEVSRRVYRSGEGEYKLNGTACRLRDIVDLFRDTGIGKEGYSLIGQGRIDDILSVRSEDRRKVFEEAAGIVKYKARKLDAQRRMENTRQNLTRVEDILSELETRVEPLKEQSETAREYLALRDELKVLDINVYLVRTERYQARLAELRASLETLSEAVGQAEEELKTVSAAREEGLGRLETLEHEAAAQREVVQKWIREVEAREGAVQVMRERILAGERERDRLISERDAARDGGGGVKRHVEELREKIEKEAGELEAFQQEQAAREEELARFEAELSALEAQAEAEKEQIIQSMNRLGDVRNQQARLETLRTALENQLSGMGEDEQRADAGMRSLDEQLAAAQELLREESERKAHFEREVANSVEQVRASSEQSRQLSEQVNARMAERQRADSRLKLLVEMQNDYEGYQHSVKQVLLYARKSGASGVHGVVAELIEVPEKLERAIDMVLGGALQNIVVERDEDAKRMIEYLRNNRFGRATFLPVGSVRPRVLDAREREVLKLPGCLGVASELIRFDEKYRGVIDNLLGRTVVAENLEAGIRIQRAGRYAFRLVTLEGDVMHSGGSMTGGSVQSRVTNLLSRGREIEQLRATLAKLDDEVIAARNELVRQEAERTRLKQERGELYDELHRQEVACARAEAQLKAVQDERASHEQSASRVRAERERLEAQLADVQNSLAAIEEHQQTAQENTAGRQERVKALMEDIYVRREKGEKLRAETSDGRVRLATRQRGLEAARADHERLSRQAEDMEKLLADSESQLEVCMKSLAENAAVLERDSAELTAGKAELDRVRGQFNETDSRRTEAQRELQAQAEQIDALRARVDEHTDKRHRCELQLQRVETEFKQIEERIWEDYELTYALAEPFRQEGFRLSESEKRISAIRARIREMGAVNVSALDEYRQTVQRLEEMTAQRDDLQRAELDLQNIVEELERKMESQFKREFAVLNQNFQRTFVKLFGGGRAELTLSDPNDALNCDIDVVAQPPGKKLQLLTLLSGGERALTAIAILFAMLDLKPTPFCILDEIEAALDDANIDNYADYLRAYSENTQFVVITHRKGTMERCNALYGVVMEEKGVSKLVSVSLNEAS